MLERRDEIAPQVGASIAMMPNGCRVSCLGRARGLDDTDRDLKILDQLGVLEELYKTSEPAVWLADRDDQGRLMAPRKDVTQLGAAR